MNYKTLRVVENTHTLMITIHRPIQKNSINGILLQEIHQVLNNAEQNKNCRFVVFQGENGFFCTGMDFQELSQGESFISADYMSVLKRFTLMPKIIISLLDGQVLAGGVGFVAASDLVISSSATQFGLSEALWGLLPACVTPFLIRRIGFQKAYHMTLTTQTVNAAEAHTIGLIDELSDNFNESLRRIQLRLQRVQVETVGELKAYFRKMWIINEMMEATAVSEINRLMDKPNVRANIKNFIEHQKFPWENTAE